MKTVDYFIRRARFNIKENSAMQSSALLCLQDAIKLINEGKYDYALNRAIESLKYSVGIFGKDYKDAVKYKESRSL